MCMCVFWVILWALGAYMFLRWPEASNPWKWSYRHSQQPDMDAGNLTLGTL